MRREAAGRAAASGRTPGYGAAGGPAADCAASARAEAAVGAPALAKEAAASPRRGDRPAEVAAAGRAGQPRRLIVGISGASGVLMAARLLRALRGRPEIETHLVVTDGAWESFRAETALTRAEVEALADVCYDSRDLAAPIASGTYETAGMLVLPCSMKTLAGLVTGYSDNLLLRAGDVCLKEGRPLVLVPRETPLSRLHLRNLKEAADLGMTIVPPMLSFYSGATTIEQQIDQILGKALRFFGIDYAPFVIWQGGRRQGASS